MRFPVSSVEKSCAHVNVVPYLFAQLCWEAFFRDSVCLFLHTGTALDCAGGRKPDDSDFVYGSGTIGKRAVEKEVRAV